MSDLKPCPFCGREPHFDVEEIYCECGASKDVLRFYDQDYENFEEAKREAIKAWNKRASNDTRG